LAGFLSVRTINWIFNKPFLWNTEKRPQDLNDTYKPAIVWVAQWLQSKYSSAYADRPILDICYELCEFNKALLEIYINCGKRYTSPPAELSEAVALGMSVKVLQEMCRVFLASAPPPPDVSHLPL